MVEDIPDLLKCIFPYFHHAMNLCVSQQLGYSPLAMEAGIKKAWKKDR